MLAFSGRAKVGGYGALAVAPKEATGQRVVNRRRYCAPEQIIGGRAAQTPQTDVFLLGLVLYECLTGRMPWDKETDFDQAVMTTPLPLDDLPAPIQELLRKATAKRASERYKTALAFRDAVDEMLAPLATPAAALRAARAPLPGPGLAARRAQAGARGGPRRARPGLGGAAAEGLRGRPPSPSPHASWRSWRPPRIRLALEDAAGLRRRGGRCAGAWPSGSRPGTRCPADADAAPRSGAGGAPARAAALPACRGDDSWHDGPLGGPGRGGVPCPGSGAAPAPAPAPTAAATPGPADARAPTRDFLTTGLELVTDPPVDVALDKKPFGRTPIVIPATPGSPRADAERRRPRASTSRGW